MKIITNEELINYIKSQKNKRKLDMRDFYGSGCGCVMIQYARDQELNPTSASNDRIHTTTEELGLTQSIWSFFTDAVVDVKNYGQLKKLLK